MDYKNIVKPKGFLRKVRVSAFTEVDQVKFSDYICDFDPKV